MSMARFQHCRTRRARLWMSRILCALRHRKRLTCLVIWSELPLIRLAWARSGDKGNKANIGIIARDAEYVPYIWAALSEESVAARFAHFIEGEAKVDKFYMPGANAINFLIDAVLWRRRCGEHQKRRTGQGLWPDPARPSHCHPGRNGGTTGVTQNRKTEERFEKLTGISEVNSPAPSIKKSCQNEKPGHLSGELNHA